MAKYLQTINMTEDEVKQARLEPFEERNKNIVIEFDKIFINENFRLGLFNNPRIFIKERSPNIFKS